MSRDSTVIAFRQSEAIDDPLSEIAREGARRMLAQVLIAEADAFVAMWKRADLSPAVITRLTAVWQADHDAWQIPSIATQRMASS